MKRLKYLYGITCPVTNEIQYIGQTYHPKQRYREHLRGNQKVDFWMREMINQGHKPDLIILDRKRKNVNQRERILIIEAKPILNKLIPVHV